MTGTEQGVLEGDEARGDGAVHVGQGQGWL